MFMNQERFGNMMNITVYSQSWCCNFQPNPWHVVLNIWKSTFNFRTILIMTPQWDSFSKSCIILGTKRPKKCEVPLVPRWGGGSPWLFSLSLYGKWSTSSHSSSSSNDRMRLEWEKWVILGSFYRNDARMKGFPSQSFQHHFFIWRSFWFWMTTKWQKRVIQLSFL